MVYLFVVWGVGLDGGIFHFVRAIYCGKNIYFLFIIIWTNIIILLRYNTTSTTP